MKMFAHQSVVKGIGSKIKFRTVQWENTVVYSKRPDKE